MQLLENLRRLRGKTFPYYKELEVIVSKETARGVGATSSLRQSNVDAVSENEDGGGVNLSQMEFLLNENMMMSSQTPISRNFNTPQPART
jgi:hypothetical protein